MPLPSWEAVDEQLKMEGQALLSRVDAEPRGTGRRPHTGVAHAKEE